MTDPSGNAGDAQASPVPVDPGAHDEAGEFGSHGRGGPESAGRRGRHAAPTPDTASRRWIIELAAILAVAGLLAWGVQAFIAQPLYVPHDSMSPTMDAGDRILLAPTTGPFGGVGVGDVIVFDVPAGWARGPADPDFSIARVIAVGGQRVTCCDVDGGISVDGVPAVEPYLAPGATSAQVPFDVVVPEGRLFVLGDERAVLLDSRAHLDVASGTIGASEVRGRVLFVVWPWGRS